VGRELVPEVLIVSLKRITMTEMLSVEPMQYAASAHTHETAHDELS
jgi:hypothetical protein